MIETRLITCPYCGEEFESSIDCSAGDQAYIEDCYVCCQPIEFSIQVGPDGELLSVSVQSGND